MGKPAGRLGDIGSNHGAWHPSPITSASSNVFINGKGAARQGDSLAPHTKPKRSPHGRTIAEGSPSVLINGKPAARVGDAISCGGNISTGSSNVFIGNNPQFLEPEEFSLPDFDFSRNSSTGEYRTPPHTSRVMGANEPVTIDDIAPQAIEELPIELKPAIVRLEINPEDNSYGTDQFILSSTDGSISITKTVADDLIPGDGFLDLQFDDLDTSKNYKLEHIDGISGERYVYFERFSYSAIGVKSPYADEEEDDDDATENNT